MDASNKVINISKMVNPACARKRSRDPIRDKHLAADFLVTLRVVLPQKEQRLLP